jgi:hypothetical protein
LVHKENDIQSAAENLNKKPTFIVVVVHCVLVLPRPAEQHFWRRVRPPDLQLLRTLASTCSSRLWNSSSALFWWPWNKLWF